VEYIREFEQLEMIIGLNKDNKLTIARFIKGLSPSIGNKVELQPYLSFNDVYHLAIKIEKQLKGRRPIHSSLARSPFTQNDPETPRLQVKVDDKGKGIYSEPLKG